MSQQRDEGTWRDEERLPLRDLTAAMATNAADGQADDATGGEAGPEAANLADDEPRPSPDGPGPGGRTGPN